MSQYAEVLLIAATEREVGTPEGWRRLLCGVGPVEAAAATAAEIASERPLVILHVGIAGARRHRSMPHGTIIIGAEARYCDLGVPTSWAPHAVMTDRRLISSAQRALPSAIVSPIGTSARVGGTTDCDVEAMEGFGVLRAAERAGVPAIEVRAICNDIEEPDRSKWHFDQAFAAIISATPLLVAELANSGIRSHA